MVPPVASGSNFALQRSLRQQVEQRFQRAGERGFIHRRGDDQAISPGQLFIERLQRRVVKTSVQEVFRGKVLQMPVADFDIGGGERLFWRIPARRWNGKGNAGCPQA